VTTTSNPGTSPGSSPHDNWREELLNEWAAGTLAEAGFSAPSRAAARSLAAAMCGGAPSEQELQLWKLWRELRGLTVREALSRLGVAPSGRAHAVFKGVKEVTLGEVAEIILREITAEVAGRLDDA
jgi:hypothetical protein